MASWWAEVGLNPLTKHRELVLQLFYLALCAPAVVYPVGTTEITLG